MRNHFVFQLDGLARVCWKGIHSFTKNFHFIDSVKAYLSYDLLRASVSQSLVISQYSTGIFSVLLLRFRESLKGEIGILFPLIVLRSLDSSECSLNQKISILRMVEKVCKDSQMLVDLYVNYDCDLEAPNLFECMCLVNVLKSLVDWEKMRRELENPSYEADDFFPAYLDVVALKGISYETFYAKYVSVQPETSERCRANVIKLVGGKYTCFSCSFFDEYSESGQGRTVLSAMIGDYLGQHEEFPLAVMHAYVNSMKFSGMKFESAIRDYCADNPGLFKNADTAYVLAYAVVILNTDAHNPRIINF
ncbi:hypothetical protein RHGRI_014296 [Rhododendron griersonianum]|uniref:SEC7 domain-containing protein n=1 Tax=Rhododendron griersonianum TaxID=479676 RepID=A0AAV6K954_9ERIC|nr:hypothetical protein RHGRI_014296 [Rhododendron griersonianum]